MYIVNTTFVVAPEAHDRWLDLLATGYIPLLRERGFSGIVFTRLIPAEAQGDHTYSLQVDAEDIPRYRLLTGALFDEYRHVADPLFGPQVLFFTTLLKKMEI